MKSLLPCLLAVAVAGFGAAACGLAPEPYVGHGIVPVDAPTIRMVSAKVDITWGYPGTLTGVFVMDNEASEAADVQVGFPVSLPKRFRHQDSLDFTMTFDGVPVERADIRRVTNERKSVYEDPAVWYQCRHRFPPGRTTVKVETRLPNNSAGSIYYEQIDYCTRTSAAWKGTIDSEEVTIHFPAPFQPGQIGNYRPAGAIVEGDTVRWRFENFKPEPLKENDRCDLDVFVWGVQPDVFPILNDLRRRADEAPGDTRRQLDLIKHLLALASGDGGRPCLSDTLKSDEYQKILTALPSEADRARLEEAYTREADGGYRVKEPKTWEREQDELIGALIKVGYTMREGSMFLTEGRARLARFLEKHPHSAEAWNIQLVHRVGYLRYDPFFFPWPVYSFQMEMAEQALRNCPDDSTIRLWEKVCRLVRYRPPVETSSTNRYDQRIDIAQAILWAQLKRRRIVVDRTGGFVVRYRDHHQRDE